MTAATIDKTGKAIGTAEIPDVFTQQPKLSVLHQAVVRHLANRRAGTADTKKRDEVSGGGRKPWRQKGTGRARHGSIRSPLWRKGGVVFGPHPRSHAIGMNKKTRRSALAMAIAAKAHAGTLFILDASGLKPAKAHELSAILWPETPGDSVLLAVHPQKDDGAREIHLAGRNLQRADVVAYSDVSAHAILAHDRFVVSRNALDALAEVCGG